MTDPDLVKTLKAQLALVRSNSPTKGPAGRYEEKAWQDAIAGVAERLAHAPFRQPRRS